MTTEPQPTAPGSTTGLVDRVKNILLQPRAEWDRISPEPVNVGALYTGYVLPLAALAAICTAIGWIVFGYGGLGFYIRLDPISGIVQAVVQLASAVFGVFLLAIIINALAPNFGSTPDQGQAHKIAAYSATASFLAGCFAIVPALAPLGILGLYSLFLLYVGLPRLMKTPDDKRVGYFVTVIIVAIVLSLLVGVVTSTVRGALPTGGFGGGALFGQNEPAPAPECNCRMAARSISMICSAKLNKCSRACSKTPMCITILRRCRRCSRPVCRVASIAARSPVPRAARRV